MNEFCRFDLRTTDAVAARAFYLRVLGHDRSVIWPLHEQALARGARPHWLGTVGVDDVERAAAAFVARGATPLGPTRPSAHGGLTAVLRDPGGAILALGTPPPASANVDVGTPASANANANIEVVWHLLHTNDAARAITDYGELLGWAPTERIELAGRGAFQLFAWRAGGTSVGAIGDTATTPAVHPHWLFFFEVDALEPALGEVRAAGGITLDPAVLPSGERVCVCDDPQGAAFALRERRRPVAV